MSESAHNEVTLITGNRHKLEEIRAIASRLGITVRQHRAQKIEIPEDKIEITAAKNARKFADELGVPVIVDDSGIEFEAYPGFPGQNPKWVFETIGFEGIMKLLKGKKRGAIFRCAASYCEPGKKPIVKTGALKGKITEKVTSIKIDVMPYERIFVPIGAKTIMAKMTRENKNAISHRAKAFNDLLSKIKVRT